MVKSTVSCHSLPTVRDKRWPYEEYYFGDRDSDGRKNGKGEHHWTGAESLEWYTGPMLRDTMHGEGDYRWRYKDPDGAFVTYEGRFFSNHMHGYGMMSYPEGRVFVGLFYNDARWGPGVERMTSLQMNVGLWGGTRLVRLCWRPPGPPVAPDLTTGPTGPTYLNPYRIVLMENTKIIGETNNAIELLKHYGADPVQATEKWTKLYPKYCTDMKSALFHKDLFDRQYYKGKIHRLEEITTTTFIETKSQENDNNEDGKEKDDTNEEPSIYYAWNNSKMMVHMMKHCFKHENQRDSTRLSLDRILNGPRKKFRSAAKHETDCRSLLMACYTGVIVNVTQLVNEENVFPDIADSQGNTALMYAVCGDQPDVIHFLIEAGANGNSVNDSCCTPLGVALMRYTCVANDIRPSLMVQTLLPPKPEKVEKDIPQKHETIEWYMNRETIDETDNSKPDKLVNMKKSKSSVKSNVNTKLDTSSTKANASFLSTKGRDYDSDDDIYSNEKQILLRLKALYTEKISSQFQSHATASTAPLFTAKDMLRAVFIAEEEMKATEKLAGAKQPVGKSAAGPKTTLSKAIRPKSSMVLFDNQTGSNTDYEKEKSELLSKIELTILQLLADGADPKLVKCPQPAIMLATKSGSSDLIRHVVCYGADVNQKFPELLDYTVLDMVIAEPFTEKNLEVIHTLLEVGADTCHRLKIEDNAAATAPDQGYEVLASEGPTLLHAVLARKTESEHEEEIRNNVVNLLLKYNADPTAQFRGRAPIECAMIKFLGHLDVFIQNPTIDLNAVINEQNHTLLVKLLSRDFFKSLLGIDKMRTLTNLLLYGADPLIECYDGETRYGNIFEFAKKTLDEMSPPTQNQPTQQRPVQEHRVSDQLDLKKGGKPSKSKTKISIKSSKAITEDSKKKDKFQEATEYRETLNMMKECAQMLHIRWLQSKLLNELTDVVMRFKQRHWAMIIKEHKNARKLSLWVTVTRALEIWDILETTNEKKFKDKNILHKTLCLVLFYQNRLTANKQISFKVTSTEKKIVESDVKLLLKEHKIASKLTKEADAWKRTYVRPELDYKLSKKYKICFECAISLDENRITCCFCGLVSFCNLNCLTSNINKDNGHPCNELLKEKYTLRAEDDLDNWRLSDSQLKKKSNL